MGQENDNSASHKALLNNLRTIGAEAIQYYDNQVNTQSGIGNLIFDGDLNLGEFSQHLRGYEGPAK